MSGMSGHHLVVL